MRNRWIKGIMAVAAAVLIFLGGMAFGIRQECRRARFPSFEVRTFTKARDGDTIHVGTGKGEDVRILGINTPEIWRRIKGTREWEKIPDPDPRAVASSTWLEQYVGRKVKLTFERDQVDMYGRLLAHVEILPEGIDVASEMLRLGYAKICAPGVNRKRYGLWKAIVAKRKSKKDVASEAANP